MLRATSRRAFLRDLGLSAAAVPFVLNLPSLGFANQTARKQRLVIMFSPNGVVPENFWPDEEGSAFTLKEILTPLAPYQDQTLILKGVCDRIRGDGDDHMRGIGCLLTGIELFPGNVQGGGGTPAGWASGISIDQEIKNFLQQQQSTRTRFGSLEFGIQVPDKADTWTRMCYAGANQPIAPIDDPYQMFAKLYGQMKDGETLSSVLDTLQEDFRKVASAVSSEDRRLLDEHASFVREMEHELREAAEASASQVVTQLEPDVRRDNDSMPQLSKLQIDLMVDSFVNDFSRIATLQYTKSVGGARLKWVGVTEGHHQLSHEPDTNVQAMEKLTKINHWFCEQLAYLCKRLAETPEPGGPGSLLDNTTIVWTNELGKGSTHTQDNIPFVMVGGGLNFAMGRSLNLKREPHNRLLMAYAHAFGHHITRFGNPDYCGAGPLSLG